MDGFDVDQALSKAKETPKSSKGFSPELASFVEQHPTQWSPAKPLGKGSITTEDIERQPPPREEQEAPKFNIEEALGSSGKDLKQPAKEGEATVANNQVVQKYKQQYSKLKIDNIIDAAKSIDKQLKNPEINPIIKKDLTTRRQALSELEEQADTNVIDALAMLPIGPVNLTRAVDGVKSLIKKGVSFSWAKEAIKEEFTEATNKGISPKIENVSKDSAYIPEIKKEPPTSRQLVAGHVKDWDYRGKADDRLVMQNIDKISKLAPTKEAREQLTKDLEDPTKRELPQVKEVRSMLDNVWQEANAEGVVKGYLQDYISHIYDFGKQSNSAAVKQLYNLIENFSSSKGVGMSTKSPFSRERTFKTLQEAADKRGLIPKTLDAGEIYNQYATSMLRARNNKIFITNLKGEINPATGDFLIKARQKDKGIEKGFETIQHPQFSGLMVDKSIAPTLRSMMESGNPFSVTKASYLLSMGAKAGIFSMSAFHIKTLGDAFVGALRSPKTITSLPSMFKLWKEGGVGDVVDTALRGGLQIGHSPDQDISILKGAAEDVGKGLDRMMPKLGNTIRIPAKALGVLNDALWKYIHPSLKLATWNQEYSRLISKGVPQEKASEIAATFTNDLFGGLNWRRIAENSNSYLGYTIANEAASRTGQRAMQIGMVAPDWTVATARSWEGAFRKDVSKEERAMYQKYLLQSGLLYAGAVDLLNQHFTGHHFWQNKDPTMLDLGEGRRMQVSKHFMEVPRWFMEPNQTMLNKLGMVPSELFKQALNEDYLSASGFSPQIVPTKKSEYSRASAIKKLRMQILYRLSHMSKAFTPITLEQAKDQGAQAAISGFAGMPIYSKKKKTN